MEFLTQVRWSPYVVGIGIGILGWFTFLISQHPIGCSTSFVRLSGMFEELFQGCKVEEMPYYQKFKLRAFWRSDLA
jgi:uncharacterized protein